MITNDYNNKFRMKAFFKFALAGAVCAHSEIESAFIAYNKGINYKK